MSVVKLFPAVCKYALYHEKERSKLHKSFMKLPKRKLMALVVGLFSGGGKEVNHRKADDSFIRSLFR